VTRQTASSAQAGDQLDLTGRDPGARSGIRAAAASPDVLGGSPGLTAAQVERAVRLIRDRVDAAQSPPVTRLICCVPPSQYPPPLSPAERAEVDAWVDRYMDPRTPTGARLALAARAADSDDAGA
jgi:hypothetical protein